jgi:MoaA/NifB/PqqE/SkfB family radical SAM enzyme
MLPEVEQMAPDLADRLMRNIDVESIRHLMLFGSGEPLLHDDLPAILHAVRRQSWKPNEVRISTNAQTGDWDRLEAVIRENVLTDLVVSCDGDSTPEMYEALRPPSRWSALVEFLDRARELRDRFAPELRLLTRTIVPHWEDRPRWSAFLREKGWTPEFSHYIPVVGSAQNMTGRPPEPTRGSCMFVEEFMMLSVNVDGSVVPCCLHPRAGVYGNLRDQTFSEIYRGDARAAFREELMARRETMAVCGPCEVDADDENAVVHRMLFPDSAWDRGLVPVRRLRVVNGSVESTSE